MNTADILERAATLIEERGHAKRVHVTKAGCLCSAGAMYAVVGMEPVPGQRNCERWPTFSWERSLEAVEAYNWFSDWLKRSGFADDVDAVQWNDRRARTKEDVVSALRAAAQAARAEQ